MRLRSVDPGPGKPRWQPTRTNDRRRSQRLDVSHPGLIRHKDRWSPIRIVDLSRHGLRVCGTGSFKAGDHVLVELTAPCRRLQLPARIVWNDHGRKRLAGISFADLCRADALALNATLIEATRVGSRYPDDVLVVTEDPSVQLALADAIWEQQHEVAMRTTVHGALGYLAFHAARARAALVSAGLAERAGPRLLDVIAEAYPAIRRVLLVDNLMDAAHAFGSTLPHFVLLSPFRSEEIARTLRGLTA